MFEQTFKATEQKMISFPHGWLEKQRTYWEKVWENDIAMERDAFALLGRKCAHFGDHVVITKLGKESSHSSAVPLRPKRRPRVSRVIEQGTSDFFQAEDKAFNEVATQRGRNKRDSLLD